MKYLFRTIRGLAAFAIIALTVMHQLSARVEAMMATGDSSTMNASPQSQPAKNPVHIEKASKLIGMSLNNFQGDKLGTVDNIMLDLSTGHVVAVIVASGGFMGMGEELSAIPPSVLSQETGQDALLLDLTPKAFATLPHFPSNEWPNLSQPAYVDGVYRTYNVPPYYVVTPTGAQIAKSKRIASQSRNAAIMTMNHNQEATMHFIRPVNEKEQQATEDLEIEIAKAEEANRLLELKR